MLRRLITVGLILVGLWATWRIGSRVFRRVSELTKIVMARVELYGLETILVSRYSLGDGTPTTGTGFRRELASLLQSPPGREPGLDPWDRPYILESLGVNSYRLRSLGPNGVPDRGCDRADPWSSTRAHARHLVEHIDDLAGDEPEMLEDDDLCVWFTLPR